MILNFNIKPRYKEDRVCPNCIFLGPGEEYPSYDMYYCPNHIPDCGENCCFTRSINNTTKQQIDRIDRGYPPTQEAYKIAKHKGYL